ncbi:hypothetical protein HMPREF0322_02567 [Desulfitobacterium hafniense DP7]|uniref:Uncharacterized protein n=1 Tax=Desulfitobacterium hafniense DP7 TaxID=537010 RepID=G9XNM4_DESHA|nr:hypothetical protein HMPREF0322_02567 [Desulfitobacterium hafniense DP7]
MHLSNPIPPDIQFFPKLSLSQHYIKYHCKSTEYFAYSKEHHSS